jgi:hypothetical protein
MQDPKWHDLKRSSIRTVTQLMIRRITFFANVSFQSTRGTNISMVNALLSVDSYVRDYSKGRGKQKMTWGIEVNEA